MRLFRMLRDRCRALFGRDIVAEEIRDEIQFHLDQRAVDLERQGVAPDDARRIARRQFGNPLVIQDRGYEVRGGGVMETIWQDVRYSLRLLRKQPGFSIIAILTLAFGIGASTALFSVIDAALLHPLPYPHPEQLVGARMQYPPSDGGDPNTFWPSLGDGRAWRDSGQSISSVGLIRTSTTAVVDAGSGPERVTVNDMSDGVLGVFGLAPVIGRDLTADDVTPGSPLVVLLGQSYWQTRFRGDPRVIGSVVRFVLGGPATVVGVVPDRFYRQTAIWRAYKIAPDRRVTRTDTIARLRPGITIEQAARELAEVTNTIETGRGQPGNIKVLLTSREAEVSGGYGPTVTTLAAAVGFILLIACVNVAGLSLARGATRRPELAIRASIGAGRVRLIRQLLTESLVLAIGGGVLGAFFAWFSLDALVALIPMTLPATASAAINIQVLTFALTLSVATSVIVGLIPAFRLSRVQLTSGFGGGTWRQGSALSRRGGQLLIGVEVALAVVLLAGAGLMVRSFSRLVAVDVGFDPSAILTMEVAPVEQTPAVMTAYYPALLESIRQIPGVATVGAVDGLPMFKEGVASVERPGGPHLIVRRQQGSARYVEAMGLRIKQGRVPTDLEVSSAQRGMVIINERLANALFPGSEAAGRELTLSAMQGQPPQQCEIVAVVGDVRQNGPLTESVKEVLVLSMQPISRVMIVVVRPAAAARVSAEQLRAAAIGVGPKVFLERIRVGSEFVDDRVVTPRHSTWLFGLLGGIGLVLTLVGIFGTTAYSVARRTQEIGVRMAFGARPGQVVRTVIGDAAWPVAIGTAVGLAGALFSTKVIATFLFQTSPTDPATFAAVAMMLGLAAGIAAWLPARRAARVDPVAALRAE